MLTLLRLPKTAERKRNSKTYTDWRGRTPDRIPGGLHLMARVVGRTPHDGAYRRSQVDTAGRAPPPHDGTPDHGSTKDA